MSKPSDSPVNRRILIFTALILISVLVIGNIFARQLSVFSPAEFVIRAENSYQLDAPLESSVVAAGETVTLTEKATVDGYAILMATDVVVDGSVQQELTALGETVILRGDVEGNALLAAETVILDGRVSGEVAVFAQNLTVNENFSGTITTACAENIANEAAISTPICDEEMAHSLFRRAARQLTGVWFVTFLNNRPAQQIMNTLLPLPTLFTLVGVGALGVVLFPTSLRNIENAVRFSPLRMAIIGVLITSLIIGLTIAQLILLAYLTIVGFLLIPVYLAVALVFAFLLVTGWITLAMTTGNWLMMRFTNRIMPPLVTMVIGGFLLIFVAYLLRWLSPNMNLYTWVFVLLGLAGVGASYTTRLGRQSILPTSND